MIDCGSRALADAFGTLRACVQVCQRRPPSARDILLKDDDPAVEQELLRRVAKGQPTGSAARGWIVEHQQLYAQLRLSCGAPPPNSRTTDSPWLETLTPLCKSTLILHQHQLLSSSLSFTASGQQRVPNLMIDLSPSAGRLSTSTFDDAGNDIAPCILPNMNMWLHSKRKG